MAAPPPTGTLPTQTGAPQSPSPTSAASAKKFSITSGVVKTAERIAIYGPPGIGKTSLAADAPNPVFVDVDEGTFEQDTKRITGFDTWDEFIDELNTGRPHWKDCETVVIDTATQAQELAEKDVIANIKTDGGDEAKSMGDYTWGKGPHHVYARFLKLFAALDLHIREGRNVIIICHECTVEVPNPQGVNNWIRYEPQLQSPKKAVASILAKMTQWSSYVFRIGYDISVDKNKKATGTGSRRIYTSERPTHLAKSRKTMESIIFTKGSPEIWNQLFS